MNLTLTCEKKYIHRFHRLPDGQSESSSSQNLSSPLLSQNLSSLTRQASRLRGTPSSTGSRGPATLLDPTQPPPLALELQFNTRHEGLSSLRCAPMGSAAAGYGQRRDFNGGLLRCRLLARAVCRCSRLYPSGTRLGATNASVGAMSSHLNHGCINSRALTAALCYCERRATGRILVHVLHSQAPARTWLAVWHAAAALLRWQCGQASLPRWLAVRRTHCSLSCAVTALLP